VDDWTPKPPPGDDPTFLASLSDLDQGLFDDPDSAGATPSRTPTVPVASFRGDPTRRLTPKAAAALAAASAALAAFDDPADSGTAAAAGTSRPSPLDLFTPAAPDPVPPSAAEAPSSSPSRGRLLMIALLIALLLAGAAAAVWMWY
jgi:hypothetical protein